MYLFVFKYVIRRSTWRKKKRKNLGRDDFFLQLYIMLNLMWTSELVKNVWPFGVWSWPIINKRNELYSERAAIQRDNSMSSLVVNECLSYLRACACACVCVRFSIYDLKRLWRVMNESLSLYRCIFFVYVFFFHSMREWKFVSGS